MDSMKVASYLVEHCDVDVEVQQLGMAANLGDQFCPGQDYSSAQVP